MFKASDGAWQFAWPLKPLVSQTQDVSKLQEMTLHFYEGIVLDLDQVKCAVLVQDIKGEPSAVATGVRPCVHSRAAAHR